VAPITCEADLEAAVGARSPGGRLKSIPHLDPHCDALLALSPFLVLGTVDAQGALRSIALGGSPGTAAPDGPSRLALPHLATDGVEDGAPAATLALVPGYGETLRVNGRLRLPADGVPHVEVEEAFVHCAKAVIRSGLWGDHGPSRTGATTPVGTSSSLDAPGVREVLARTPFVALFSLDADGLADVSPKGDPAGFVQVLDDRRIAIPDRPGNLRTDTMHNVLSRPELGVLALVPGTSTVLELRGRAELTDDLDVREAMSVAGKVPKAAIVVAVDHVDVRDDPAPGAAHLWDRDRHVERGALPRASQMWVDHVALHQEVERVAAEHRFTLDPDAMHDSIEVNYREGLY
jgi:predicted pyridoxine 5'-phosphate oxidase superfamily flavin-nucleotide-binding protein